jgi:predicted dehydrogenase
MDGGAMRIALFGCGGWGTNILRDLRALDCRVTVVDPSEAARDKALAAGAQSAVATLDRTDADFDGYVIAAPLAAHAPIIRSLLPRARPIFCEKALTASSAQAYELARVAGDRLFTMHKWAYHGGVLALRDLVASGELGRLQTINCLRLGWGQAHVDVDAVWVLLPHDLSIVLHLLGELPPARSACAEWAGADLVGLRGWLEGEQVSARLHVSARWPQRQRSIILAFEHGIASLLDPMADHLLLQWGRGADRLHPEREERRGFDMEPPLYRELRVFVEHLRGGPPPWTSALEGARVVERLEDLRRLAGVDDPVSESVVR